MKKTDLLRGPNLVRTGNAGSIGALANELAKRSKGLKAVIAAGGLVADHGWVRLFGGGGDLPSIDEWNADGGIELDDAEAHYVAADVVGGLFVLDASGAICYLSPDGLELEELTDDYESFLSFVLTGDLDTFYADYRFKRWEKATEELSIENAYFSYPPVWADGGTEAFLNERKVVPALELRDFVLQAFADLNQ